MDLARRLRAIKLAAQARLGNDIVLIGLGSTDVTKQSLGLPVYIPGAAKGARTPGAAGIVFRSPHTFPNPPFPRPFRRRRNGGVHLRRGALKGIFCAEAPLKIRGSQFKLLGFVRLVRQWQ
jgi:hypothetical protein